MEVPANRESVSKDHKVLLTGDFWHQDFQGIVSQFDVPATLVPIEKIESVSDSKFDLVIIAQSRRNQFQSIDIDRVFEFFPNTPLVALLGSWCEGEVRSGQPIAGVVRIYWHQWSGRYERFISQLGQNGITDWHAPKTSSVADRIELQHSTLNSNLYQRKLEMIGISAWTQSNYEMLADAVQQFGWQSRWIERAFWDAESTNTVSAVCIDARSWSDDVKNRIKWIRSEFPLVPMVLVVSYPRASELDEIEATGIGFVVSKPFELVDLKSALNNAIEQFEKTGTVINN